jgi:hypothetical protein
MSRIVAGFGLVACLLAACTWADCKKDAQVTGEVLADCGPDIAQHIIDGIHNGVPGILGDVFQAVSDGQCVSRSAKLHAQETHGCAADAGVACISSAQEQQLWKAALAIEQAIKSKAGK